MLAVLQQSHLGFWEEFFRESCVPPICERTCAHSQNIPNKAQRYDILMRKLLFSRVKNELYIFHNYM